MPYLCPKCGMTSYHPRDVEHGYCGNCHDWTEDYRLRFAVDYPHREERA